MKNNYKITLIITIILLVQTFPKINAQTEKKYGSKLHNFTLTKVVDKLNYPWALSFLPDKSLLITERKGRLVHYNSGKKVYIQNIPEVYSSGQGGLLDIALHPDFKKNRLLFISYSARDSAGDKRTTLARAILSRNSLKNLKVIFQMKRGGSTSKHFGSRIAFLKDKTVLLTIGERGEKERAQKLNDHAGKLIRINSDGTIPANNPFVNIKGTLPEIYSYGHRNAQGLLVDKRTNTIYLHEHGPKGGDEINIVKPGKNYGWPVITYGKSYAGFKIGIGTHHPKMEQPLLHWTPSIAPSGFMLYSGKKFKKWRGDFFVGALVKRHLRRVKYENGKLIEQEELLTEEIGRIRDVREGPDGYIWILTDKQSGEVYRIEDVK